MHIDTFGEKLKCLRKNTGLTQKQMADAIPTSFSTYRRWENDKHPPDLSMLLRLSELLNTSITYLTGEQETAGKSEKLPREQNTAPINRSVIDKDSGKIVYTFRDGERIELPATHFGYNMFKEIYEQKTKTYE